MPYLPGASFYLRNKEANGKIPKKRVFARKSAGSATPIAARQISIGASRCNEAPASPRPRALPQDIPEKGATRPPFSRTSTMPEAVNSCKDKN
jgi:hypothetical protein